MNLIFLLLLTSIVSIHAIRNKSSFSSEERTYYEKLSPELQALYLSGGNTIPKFTGEVRTAETAGASTSAAEHRHDITQYEELTKNNRKFLDELESTDLNEDAKVFLKTQATKDNVAVETSLIQSKLVAVAKFPTEFSEPLDDEIKKYINLQGLNGRYLNLSGNNPSNIAARTEELEKLRKRLAQNPGLTSIQTQIYILERMKNGLTLTPPETPTRVIATAGSESAGSGSPTSTSASSSDNDASPRSGSAVADEVDPEETFKKLLNERKRNPVNEIFLRDGFMYTIKKRDGTSIPAVGYRNGTLTLKDLDQNLGYVLISADGKEKKMWGLYFDGKTWQTTVADDAIKELPKPNRRIVVTTDTVDQLDLDGITEGSEPERVTQTRRMPQSRRIRSTSEDSAVAASGSTDDDDLQARDRKLALTVVDDEGRTPADLEEIQKRLIAIQDLKRNESARIGATTSSEEVIAAQNELARIINPKTRALLIRNLESTMQELQSDPTESNRQLIERRRRFLATLQDANFYPKVEYWIKPLEELKVSPQDRVRQAAARAPKTNPVDTVFGEPTLNPLKGLNLRAKLKERQANLRSRLKPTSPDARRIPPPMPTDMSYEEEGRQMNRNPLFYRKRSTTQTPDALAAEIVPAQDQLLQTPAPVPSVRRTPPEKSLDRIAIPTLPRDRSRIGFAKTQINDPGLQKDINAGKQSFPAPSSERKEPRPSRVPYPQAPALPPPPPQPAPVRRTLTTQMKEKATLNPLRTGAGRRQKLQDVSSYPVLKSSNSIQFSNPMFVERATQVIAPAANGAAEMSSSLSVLKRARRFGKTITPRAQEAAKPKVEVKTPNPLFRTEGTSDERKHTTGLGIYKSIRIQPVRRDPRP